MRRSAFFRFVVMQSMTYDAKSDGVVCPGGRAPFPDADAFATAAGCVPRTAADFIHRFPFFGAVGRDNLRVTPIPNIAGHIVASIPTLSALVLADGSRIASGRVDR